MNERLEDTMAGLRGRAEDLVEHKVDMRTAAYIVAIDRVATVTRMRGVYA